MAIDYDNEGTMTWVETSLQYASYHNRSKLLGLLMAVRGEIALEMKLAKRAPGAHQESWVR